MQVSQSDDAVTNAIITTNKSIEMRSADTAAFFSLLSASLYSNPILAMVREVICNGWDAHIAVGKRDVPLSISTKDSELVIRDYGPGIAKEAMADIYGVYGASTKTDSSEMTGGFGLGCKSPFAYTDSFTVISYNSGTKTIYCLSKASMVHGGKPTITEMVSVPSEETGLEVRIPISLKAHEINRYIPDVIREGDIFANFNGKEVKDRISVPEGDTWIMCGDLNDWLSVRYGDVVYPVKENDGYKEELKETIRFHSAFDWTNEKGLLLIAEPDSLSITPSREQLYYSAFTVETIKQLLAKFNDEMNQGIKKHALELFKAADESYVKHNSLMDLLAGEKFINSCRAYRSFRVKPLSNSNIMLAVLTAIESGYALDPSIRSKVQEQRQRAALANPDLDKGLVQTFIAEGCKGSNAWFQRRVIMGIKKVAERNNLVLKKLYAPHYDNSWAHGQPELKSLSGLTYMSPTHSHKYCEKKITIAHNKGDASTSKFLYVVPRKNEEIKAAIDAFTKAGYAVHDLTEEQKVAKPKPVAKAEKRATGYATLASVHEYMSDLTMPPRHMRVLIEKPEFFILVNRGNNCPISFYEHKFIIKEYGTRGVVVDRTAVADRLKKQGVPSLIDFLINEFMKNKDIHTYWQDVYVFEKELDKVIYDLSVSKHTVAVLRRIEALVDEFNLPKKASREDGMTLNLYKAISYKLQWQDPKDPVFDVLDAVPPKYTAFFDWLKKATKPSLIDWSGIVQNNSSHKDEVNNFIKLILPI